MTRLLLLLGLAACGTAATSSVDCTTLAAAVPAGRGELEGIWDGPRQRLLLFGGNEAIPENCAVGATDLLDDLWAFHTACEAFGEVQVKGDKPSARARAAVGHDTTRQQLVLHGGRFRAGDSGAYTVRKDTWVLDLATDTWRKLKGEGPPARFDHVGAVFGDRFVIWGGNDSTDGAVIAPRNDVWVLDLATESWSKLTTKGNPVPRTYAAAAADDGHLYVFGGGGSDALVGSFMADLWSLDVATGSWTELHDGSGKAPRGRIWADLVHDAERDRLLLWAGHDDGELGNTNQIWAFGLGTGKWTQVREGDVHNQPANGFCDFPADFTLVDPESPERREAGVAVWAEGELMIFGGKADCGNLDDVWTYDPAADVWTERSRATSGEVCPRIGGTCSSMCF
ncbi:MAG: hypothetical protein H6732_14495 [Alphaproteobacteria bacterium]|nr:hypothetical protein [Alphaproteobacteria bacterium]